MKSCDLRILMPAAEEARKAYLWYRERNEAAAERFRNLVSDGLREIREHPDRWPVGTAGARRFLVLPFPYVIVYVVKEQTVVVLAVAHTSRRPGYWRKRAY